MHTPMLMGWTVSVAVLGLVFGAISPSFDAFDSEGIQDMLARIGGAGPFRDTLLAAVFSVVALVVTAFAIAVVSHGGAEEHDGRTDQVLATATSRARTFVATALVALGGATWLLLVSAVALALGVGNATEHSFGWLVASALAHAPSVWVVVALALLCFALRSRWALLGWGLLVLFVTLGQIGGLLDLPPVVLDLSPYTHAPRMPQESFDPVSSLVLTAIAAAALGSAWLRFRTRDIG